MVVCVCVWVCVWVGFWCWYWGAGQRRFPRPMRVERRSVGCCRLGEGDPGSGRWGDGGKSPGGRVPVPVPVPVLVPVPVPIPAPSLERRWRQPFTARHRSFLYRWIFLGSESCVLFLLTFLPSDHFQSIFFLFCFTFHFSRLRSFIVAHLLTLGVSIYLDFYFVVAAAAAVVCCVHLSTLAQSHRWLLSHFRWITWNLRPRKRCQYAKENGKRVHQSVISANHFYLVPKKMKQLQQPQKKKKKPATAIKALPFIENILKRPIIISANHRLELSIIQCTRQTPNSI